MKKSNLNYHDALTELQQILQYFEQEETDLDQVLAKAKRAGELIQFCKNRLTDADLALKKIFEYDEGAQTAGSK